MRRKKSFGFTEVLLAAVLHTLWIQSMEAGQSTAALNVERVYERGKLLFLSGHYFESMQDLDKVITHIILSEGDAKALLGEIHKSSLEYRARARWQLTDSRGAREDLTRLIQEDTSWEVEAPELLELFRELQDRLTGRLEVLSRPVGAQVFVDGNYVGNTNLDPPVRVLAGTRTLQLRLNCYETLVRERFKIEPGKVNPFPAIGESVDLQRIAASYKVATQPTNVEIWENGQQIARTSGIISPLLGVALQAPFDGAKVSDVVELCLSPGRHLLEFRKDCYSVSRQPTSELELRSYDLNLLGLEESRGTIAISGSSSGARVFVDDIYSGDVRPDGAFAIDGVCSGDRVVEIRHDGGKCRSDVEVSAGQTLDVDCPLRPTIVFLGVTGEDGVRSRVVQDIETKVLENIRDQDRYYVVSMGELEGALDSSVHDLLLGSPSAFPSQRLLELSEAIGEKYQVQALLAAYVREQDFVKDVEFRLLAVGSASPDMISINYIQGLPDFVTRLTEPLSLFGTRIGIDAIDTLSGGTNPVVLYVHRDSPATDAGIAPGDKLAKADGETLQSARQLFQIIQRKSPGDSLELEILKRGASFRRRVRLQLGPDSARNTHHRRRVPVQQGDCATATIGFAGAGRRTSG